ncbi:MAG: adenine nucleotide alpha hydrolase family protein [archaeon]|nr:adenine nucleotide alpha hydrolase family protein [archaeon]
MTEQSLENKFCISCNEQAVVFQKQSGRYLCKACYIRYFERSIRKTITKYQLIRNDDKLCIGVSGGKDSLALLFNLYERQSRIKGFKKITVIHVDEGIEGYHEVGKQNLNNFLDKFEMDINLIELSFKEDFGRPLDELTKMIKEKDIQFNACTICGTIRRRLINEAALKEGATKLAIGHNLDDSAQTLLLNILRNDVNKIKNTLPHASGGSNLKNIDKNFVPRIKPLIHLTNKEIEDYCHFKGIPVIHKTCPNSLNFPIFRYKVKNFLESFDNRNYEVKYNLLNAHYEISNSRNEKKVKKVIEFKRCELCDQPMGPNRKICMYCEFKKKFID